MIGILLACVLYGLLLRDAIRLRRLHRRGGSTTDKRRIKIFLIIDLLPVLLLIGLLFDNPPTVMRFSMWVAWLWITITAARLCYGLFAWMYLRRLAVVMATLTVAASIYGAAWGRQNLRTERVEVCSDRLPAAFDGYRIAFFSDLHLGALVDTRGEVGRLVERINSLDADVVFFGGDLVNIRYTELDSLASALLSGIKAPVYAVIGNHDVGTYIQDTTALPAAVSYNRLVERQRAMGWNVLQDTTLYLYRGADSISLSGFAYNPAFKEERHDRDLPMSGAEEGYRGVPTDLYNITLIHVPQHWAAIKERGYGDLTLSGHTHAMQLKLRIGKCRGLSPARVIYPEWSGRYDDRHHTLYINDGIGYVAYPMRIGARPEVTLITLKRCE